MILKKASRRQQKHENYTEGKKSYKCKEGFNAQAINAIRRGAVKCSGEMAYLLRITLALFGHSCNKFLILMGRCVADVLHGKIQMSLTIHAFSQAPSVCARTQHLYTKI